MTKNVFTMNGVNNANPFKKVFVKPKKEVTDRLKNRKWFEQLLLWPLFCLLIAINTVERIAHNVVILHKIVYIIAYNKVVKTECTYAIKKVNPIAWMLIWLLVAIYIPFIIFNLEYWQTAKQIRSEMLDRTFLKDDLANEKFIVKACAYVQEFPYDIWRFLTKNFAFKGYQLIAAILVVIAIWFAVGFSSAENAKKQMSLENPIGYEYYVVEPNDGWDAIAYKFKPDYMGIRDNFIDGNKYNYVYYLKLCNPDVDMLKVGQVIECPTYKNIYQATPNN